MNRLHRLAWLIAIASGVSIAQEEIDLDAVPAAKPSTRRAGDGIRMGDLKFNVYFDGGLLWSKEAQADSKADLRFMQEHRSLFARASTPDGIEVYADIVNPNQVFEGTVPLRFFASSLEGMPVLGDAAIRGGRMIVPFGDFEDHPIYGGTVSNSRLLREVVWSDYGMSLILPLGFARTEIYAVNGILSFDSSAYFTSTEETNLLKGFGTKIRLDPATWFFVTFSAYHDFITLGPDQMYVFRDSTLDTLSGTMMANYDTTRISHDSPDDAATLLGLDIGLRTGPFSWRAGGAQAWIKGRYVRDTTATGVSELPDYTMWGWYGEAKWRITDTWALRLRGGQVDPDSRSVDDLDQTNVNLAAIWTKGPVDVRLTYFRNFETHWITETIRPLNKHRVLLETFVSI
jgi:hypothetical protein